MDNDDSLSFELAMRQFFGGKAYHIADGANNPTYAKRWLIKAVKKMQKDVDDLDTTTRHKERLMSDLENLEKSIKTSKNQWNIIFRLFFLCSRLLGYDFAIGVKFNNPFYYQTLNQYYHTKNNLDQDFNIIKEHSKDTKNTILKRKEIIKSLKLEGYDNFHIALILGISEYQVIKILKDI